MMNKLNSLRPFRAFALLLLTVSCSNENSLPSPTEVSIQKIIINTPNEQPVESKEEYIENSLMTIFDEYGDIEFSKTMKIKGRGNMNWFEAKKKAYAVKFAEKESILGLPEGKSWVLLGNYYDKTLLRTDVALYISEQMSKLEYTPRFGFVLFELNGNPQGIYQLGEKPRISKHRVNAGNDGFLLEIDAKAYADDDITFTTPHLAQPVNIKDPDVEMDDENYNYVKEFVRTAEAALYSDDFTDEEEGYRKYMDIDSFVEWYLVNEIAKNNDAIFYTSCYMSLERGGKLKMGPVWDFDWAFGGTTLNDNHLPEGFWVKYATWYGRLFEDPAFVAQVKRRFNELYTDRQQIYDHIDFMNAALYKYLLEENRIWGRISPKEAEIEEVSGSHQEKVDALKAWIETRFQWLNGQLNAL